ncbi:hypothetical protein JR334_00675 [Clostridia bacterium]|nr:hypothetical protein JR334_00675 [Clostridia bacterium]
MRSIPTALKEKLANRFKVENTDSMANLRVVATQTSVNSLLSEPIHEDITPAFGDVAVRQSAGESDLSLAYSICLDDGVAKVYIRKFPAGLEYPWEYQWTLGTATDVAIEFNGVWKMNAEKEWYYLQTEEYPYIFYVRYGNLYVQSWTDSNNVSLLATGVSQISSCKGWQSSVEPDLDQGLIIGYLKSGSVYYRALCCQDNGSYIWEAEHEVTPLGTGNTTLSVVRTNDFRIGFLTQNNGRMLLALTHRNYAGMSVRPETVHINASNVKMWISDIDQMDTLSKEYASGNAAYPYVLLDEPDTEEISVASVEKLNRDTGFLCYGFKINLTKPLNGSIDAGFPVKCTLSVSGVTITSTSYDSEEQAIVLYTSSDIRRTVAVTITTPEYRSLWYYKLGSQRWFLPALSVVAAAETMDYFSFENETAGISIVSTGAWIDEAVFTECFQPAHTAVIAVVASSVSLQPVSTLPI